MTNIHYQPLYIHNYEVKRYSEGSVTEEQTANLMSSKDKKKKKKFDDVTYFTVLKNGRAIFAFFSIALGLSLWTFIDTTLTNKL